jgi:hypothetical protein
MCIPERLALEGDDLETALAFFNNLRSRTILRGLPTFRGMRRVGWMRGYTDFTTVRSISPGAALILAAEYDRIMRAGGIPPNAIDLEHWDRGVYSALYQLGFFRLLGFNDDAVGQALPEPNTDAILIAPMQRGDTADVRDAGEALLELFVEVGGDNALRVSLFGAVVDAIENVRAHAYRDRPPQLSNIIPPFWWMSGAADRVKRRLTLSIYDQGVTVPVTLPVGWPRTAIGNMFNQLFRKEYDPDAKDRDGEALEAAMRLSQTSTGQTERGKGLSKIRSVVESCGGGRLRLISRRGNYTYADGVDTYSTVGVPLMGTYVEIEATF